MNAIFTKDEFAIQIISSGSFEDNDPGFRGKVFLVETATIRLNHIALNEWLFAQTHDYRDSYETDQEWQDYLSTQKARLDAITKKISAAVGYDPEANGVSISQIVSEVFAVAYIHEVPNDKEKVE